jgi:hypothetical protein
MQRDHQIGVAHQQPQPLDPQDGVSPHDVLARFVAGLRQGRSRREALSCRHLREAEAVQGAEVVQRVYLGVTPKRARATSPNAPLVEHHLPLRHARDVYVTRRHSYQFDEVRFQRLNEAVRIAWRPVELDGAPHDLAAREAGRRRHRLQVALQ